jgi:hypothetical protein
MTVPRFVIPKVNLLDEAIFNKQRRDISDEFFLKKTNIRKQLISIVKPLEKRRESALRYIRRERNTAASFLRPTDMTRTQFLDHDLLGCSCIWCLNWSKRHEFQDKLLGLKRDIELAKNRYETKWTQIHEAQARALDSLHFNRHL